MPAAWVVCHWPRCDYHAFLSHCAEDRDRLVVPVQQRLAAAHITSWLDLHQYPAGRDPFEILREEVLRCRHVVFFVTENMLRQGRGWSAVECGYSELVQRALTHGSLEVSHVILPLVLVARDHSALHRSVWNTLLPKAAFYPGRPRSLRERIEWATYEIEAFVRREELWGLRIGERIQDDTSLAARFRSERNLFQRIIGASPTTTRKT